jgi:hypothetical protein
VPYGLLAKKVLCSTGVKVGEKADLLKKMKWCCCDVVYYIILTLGTALEVCQSASRRLSQTFPCRSKTARLPAEPLVVFIGGARGTTSKRWKRKSNTDDTHVETNILCTTNKINQDPLGSD